MSQVVRQSRKAGWVGVNGYPVCLFEALTDLTCADCGALIPAGETFTRAVRSRRTTAPICRACRPVEPLDPATAGHAYRLKPGAPERYLSRR